MFFAELADADNNIFSAIGRGNDEAFLMIALGELTPHLSNTDLGTGFCTHSMSKFCKAYLLARFREKARLIRFVIKVEAILSKWFERIKPVLLTSNLKYGEHQFQDFEGKGLFTVLIPGILQFGIMVLIVSERIEMLVASVAKLNSTANVELASNGTSDLINAGCIGDAHTNLFFPAEVKAVVS